MATGARPIGNPPKSVPATSILTRTIPHGQSPAERRAYVDEIVKYSPQYYCFQGKWGVRFNYNLPDRPVYLVEVWDDAIKPNIHPGRHPFRRVVEPRQKDIWLKKAEGPLTAIAVELRAGRVPSQGVLTALGILRKKGPLPSLGKNYHKSEDVPQWANVTNLIGYTCESDITWIFDPVIKNEVPHSKNVALKALPSVYFKQGHLTSDHDEAGNIGWRSETGPCLFFGNVLEEYIR